MKIRFFILLLIGSIVLSGILGSCKKNEENNSSNNNSTLETGTFTDSRDNKTYKWVKIGEQVWMAENLNYDAGSGSWVYDNNTSNASTYGRLYDWGTACNVCPDGWHLPSDAEWNELFNSLGGIDVAGGKMKETGTTHWDSPNEGATNESGFSVLPGGIRLFDDGSFRYLGGDAYFWSSTVSTVEGQSFASGLEVNYGEADVNPDLFNKGYGFSVRCVRD